MRTWKQLIGMSSQFAILNFCLLISAFILLPAGCAQQQGVESRQASEPRAGTLTAQPIDTQYTFTIIGNQPGGDESAPELGPLGETPTEVTHSVTSEWTTSSDKTTAMARAVVQNVTIEINTAGGSAADSAARAQATGELTSNPNATLEPETTLSAQLPIAMGLGGRIAMEGTAAGQGGQARGGNDEIDQSGAVAAGFDPLADGPLRERLRAILTEWLMRKLAAWLNPPAAATPAAQPAAGVEN